MAMNIIIQCFLYAYVFVLNVVSVKITQLHAYKYIKCNTHIWSIVHWFKPFSNPPKRTTIQSSGQIKTTITVDLSAE